jgi:uncharacterized membrane protein YeaQ/YmgE (transglycosylase-associated protein family)
MEAFMGTVQQWANTILVWIGFGTVVGLTARALIPGRDQAGALVTLFMGIAGSVVGMGALAYFWDGHKATPVSPLGFVAALAGSSLLLVCHRLLQGASFRADTTDPSAPTRRRRPALAGRDN